MPRNAPTARRRLTPQRGFTLVEVSTVLCIVAVAVGAAAPSFERALQRRHLEGAAAQLVTDVQHARSLAVARGASVRLTVQAVGPNASCYVVHTGAASDCSCAAAGKGAAGASCRNGAQALHVVEFDARSKVQLTSSAASMLFDAHKGTVTPTATLKLAARDGSGALHEVVNIMGRVRTCSPGGAVPGYTPC